MIAFAYYLLKVIICSGVLFFYYHIALRNKLFHQWNRFYLLIAVVISLVAPVIQISILNYSSQPTNKAIQILQVFQSADGYFEEVTVRGRQGISIEQWLLMIYLIMSALLLVSLLLSLQKILSIIKSHTIQWVERIRFINTRASNTPFSFFNFIFWNEEISIHTETGQQIFRHELVHVKERHTLDKLFVQLILIIFWCNPFFWLIRKELRLIHEFIADKNAVGEHGTAALAAMILSAAYPTRFNSITNQFFQTSIKRRLAMLTKNENPRISYLGRIVALPLLIITVLAFTLRTKNVVVPATTFENQITVVIDAGHGTTSNGKPGGVTVGDINEDAIVLAIAKKIKELNKNDKLKIILTRTSNEAIDLHKRVDLAKDNNANLFVSLHIDAASQSQEPGTTSEKSLSNGFGIYVSNKQPVYQKQSELLGSILRQELNSIYPTNPYLLKRKVGIWVLDQNVCPSVLVECGFLTDEKDRQFIMQEKNQDAVARNILFAIERYAANNQDVPPIDTLPKKQIDIKANSPQQSANTSLFDSENQPLYIVDGKEVSKTEVSKIDPMNIESISVFKDKESINKFGKKGANGVIEIKLKKQNKNPNITVMKPESDNADDINANRSLNQYHSAGQALTNTSADTLVPKKEFNKVVHAATELPQIKLSELNNFTQLNIPNLVRFELVCPAQSNTATHINEGAEFDETTKALLSKSKAGDIVAFDHIFISENGKEIKRPGLMFGISQ